MSNKLWDFDRETPPAESHCLGLASQQLGDTSQLYLDSCAALKRGTRQLATRQKLTKSPSQWHYNRIPSPVQSSEDVFYAVLPANRQDTVYPV